jgi:hypothetical protein
VGTSGRTRILADRYSATWRAQPHGAETRHAAWAVPAGAITPVTLPMTLPTSLMSRNSDARTSGVAYDDLKVAAALAVLRLAPGSGEADRVAHVRRLLDVSADLGYAASTYAHRLLTLSRRGRTEGDVKDETAALQDALDAFGREVRMIADTYRALVTPSAEEGSPTPALARASVGPDGP